MKLDLPMIASMLPQDDVPIGIESSVGADIMSENLGELDREYRYSSVVQSLWIRLILHSQLNGKYQVANYCAMTKSSVLTHHTH